mgnify:FL=1
MAHINVSSQTTLLDAANFFVFALYDASAPATLLESIAPAKPYGNPLQVTFTYNCVNGHIYIIKLWESVDSTPTGTVRNQYSQTIALNSVEVRLPEYLEVDVTTGLVSGVNTFEKADYENWELLFERIGQGTLTPESATDILAPKYKRTNSDNSPNDLGPKITLLTADDIFQPNENFVVTFIPQIIVAAPGGTPSDPFSSGRIITADETLTNADLSQALIIQSAISAITITMPVLSTIADFRFMYFYSCGGAHKNAVFTCQGTDKFLYPTDQASLILGQAENLTVFKAFGKYQVFNDLFGVKMVGELLYNYLQIEINTLFCDGTTKLRAEYPRLWAFVQTLEAGAVVSDATWTGTFTLIDGVNVYTKKGCFSTGDGSTTFRLPLLTNMMLKGADGSIRIAAAFENHQLMTHYHKPPNIWNESGNGHLASGGTYNEGITADVTGAPVNSSGVALTAIGSENKVKNTGAYLLIRY